MIRNNLTQDSLMFYELLDESENEVELQKTIDNLMIAFKSGIWDLCDEMGWNPDDIEIK